VSTHLYRIYPKPGVRGAASYPQPSLRLNERPLRQGRAPLGYGAL